MSAWEQTAADVRMLEREIEPFLPDRIFDAHAHLFCRRHYDPGSLPPRLQQSPECVGLSEYRSLIEWIHPRGRTRGGLFFGLAFTGDYQANNRWVASEVKAGQATGAPVFGQMIVPPSLDPELVRETVRSQGFVGLKCYHTMARVPGATWDAPIEAYLPEQHVRVAHEEGLSITLHMVRDRALADPANQATIVRYCKTYPNMRLILAHAARGFNPWHTIEGIGSLAGLSNVWFDTSAVTEAGAFEAIVETMGHAKLLYGSDFYISHLRGRCVAMGDSFHWIYSDELDRQERHIMLEPVLIGLESLRALRLAAMRLKLSDRQIEDIFYNNAAALFAVAGVDKVG